ncbi:MAG TPA: SdrD B-like domain-containing protein, partial [Candidatus Saccharimonadales bacterium]
MLNKLKKRFYKLSRTIRELSQIGVTGVFVLSQLITPFLAVQPLGATRQDPNPNDVAYWCGSYDGGVKFDDDNFDQNNDNELDTGTLVLDPITIEIVDNGKTEVGSASGDGVTITKIIVKGGSSGGNEGNGNQSYDPVFDFPLAAPDNSGGQQSDVSHVIVCYDNVRTGDIKVKKYEDKDGDGRLDGGENDDVGGWKIRLYDSNWNFLEELTTSDSNWVEFEDLPYGTYFVCEKNQSGWAQTDPESDEGVANDSPNKAEEAARCWQVTVDDDDESVRFGNQELPTGDIKVKKFNDKNGSGLKANDEPYLEDWTIRLYNANWQLVDNGQTDDSSWLEFEDLILGQYFVCEVQKTSWAQTAPGSNTGVSNQSGETDEAEWCFDITLTKDEDEQLKFGNQERPEGELKVKKVVINDDGGTMTAGDFRFKLNDGTPTYFNEDAANELMGQNVLTLPAGGSYDITEPTVNGYATTYTSCYQVTIVSGQTQTCIITNNDIAPILTLKKIVEDKFGDDAEPKDWLLTAQPDTGDATSGNGEDGFIDVPLKAGTTYTLSEAGPDGYEAGEWVCTSSAGTFSQPNGSDSVRMRLGADVTCEITNTSIGPMLRLKKIVYNNNGGKALASDFRLTAADGVYTVIDEYGEQAQYGNFASTQWYDVQTDKWYKLSEYGPDGYRASGWECDGGYVRYHEGNYYVKLGLADRVTCKIVNHDIAPRVIVKKITLDGGHNPFVSQEKFDFEVKNIFHPWDEHDFKLDTNPFTWWIDNEKEIELNKAGLIKISEDEERGWTTYVKCFKLGDNPELLLNNSLFSNPFGFGFDHRPDNKTIEWVGIGETLKCIFLNVEKAEVEVIKYHDLNQNGEFDKYEEPKLPDWKFFLDKCNEDFNIINLGSYGSCEDDHNLPFNQNFGSQSNFWNHGCWGGHDYCETTDYAGEAEFDDIKPFTTYKLSEKLKKGWIQGSIKCDYRGHNGYPNGEGVATDYNEYLIRPLPGAKIKCYVGNYQDAELTIAKSNDAVDALLPGQTANFTIVVTNPAENSGNLYDVIAYDLLPQGLTYVSGSAQVNDVAAVPEPDYTTDDPAEWHLGDMSPGDVKTLTYTAIVDEDTQPGTYTNVAWTDGCEQLSLNYFNGETFVSQEYEP